MLHTLYLWVGGWEEPISLPNVNTFLCHVKFCGQRPQTHIIYADFLYTVPIRAIKPLKFVAVFQHSFFVLLWDLPISDKEADLSKMFIFVPLA